MTKPKQQLIDLIKDIEEQAKSDKALHDGLERMRITAKEWGMDFYDFAILKMSEWLAEERARNWLKSR